MNSFGKFVVKHRKLIMLIGVLLLIPSALGMINTRVNYDILYYLPEEIETMKGQDILVDQFGTGSFSMFVVEGMETKDITKMKSQIEEVNHVKKVVWFD